MFIDVCNELCEEVSMVMYIAMSIRVCTNIFAFLQASAFLSVHDCTHGSVKIAVHPHVVMAH